VLYSPTKTTLFRSGAATNLSVQVVGGQISCFIGGVEVANVREDRLTSGGFGVFATAKTLAEFDDFLVQTETAAGSAGISDPLDSGSLFSGEYGGVTYRYAGGKYLVDASATANIGLAPYARQALNFDFSVDTALLKGDPVGGYGIYVRDHKSESGYNQFRLLLSGDWFAVEQSRDDRPLALSRWARHSAIKAGESNRLRVLAEGRNLRFYINDQEVYSLQDEHPFAGSFGFYCCGGASASFDNLSFRQLE
jgi:hypothetical protein